jgi:lycopene beta-cyclase
MPFTDEFYDYIIVGGGLQGGLLTLAIRYHNPDATILLIERGENVGGNHTWSFHPEDVPHSAKPWLEPLVSNRWSEYFVRFPGFERRLHLPYASINSKHFADVVESAFPRFKSQSSRNEPSSDDLTVPAITNRIPLHRSEVETADRQFCRASSSRLLTNTEVKVLTSNAVMTSEGITYSCDTAIDCRGLSVEDIPHGGGCGYQKFVGFEFELSSDWPETHPVIMDACRSQAEGFRFMYTLPFSPRRILIEDTQFSDHPRLERADCYQSVIAFLRARTDSDWSIVREESGCLPMPYTRRGMPCLSDSVRGGYAGGWFHAATGYSFPLAVRFAEAVGSAAPGQLTGAVAALIKENRFPAKFSRFLNRLLFRLVKADSRWGLFRRFYRVLSEREISRFYAHRITVADACRIVVGRPPFGMTPLRFANSLLTEK